MGGKHNSDHPVIRSSDIPTHVAIIMDGNGRWAKARGLPRTAGHKQGAEAARRIVEAAAEAGVEYLTLFGFSTENWTRPEDEVKELMKLLRYYLRSETAELHRKNAVLKVIGDRSAFQSDIIELIENAEALTKDNTGIKVIMALNYGGRMDIASAVQAAAQGYLDKGSVPDDLDEICLDINENLMSAGVPDPDLLIRTSGEQRISNFLLWQCAYAEFIFTPVLWPDFNAQVLGDILEEYAGRDRRYGGLGKAGQTRSKGK